MRISIVKLPHGGTNTHIHLLPKLDGPRRQKCERGQQAISSLQKHGRKVGRKVTKRLRDNLASSRVSGGTPPRQGVQVFSARVSVMGVSPRSLRNAMAHGQRSISPNTISGGPRIAVLAASMCPRLRKSTAWGGAYDSARILRL